MAYGAVRTGLIRNKPVSPSSQPAELWSHVPEMLNKMLNHGVDGQPCLLQAMIARQPATPGYQSSRAERTFHALLSIAESTPLLQIQLI